MSEDPLHNPHDKLFKAGFSDPATAAAFLQDMLPPVISAGIEWDSLALEPGSFVSAKMRERHSDLLFSASFAGRKAFVYILFEHLSRPDSWLGLRLLEYMLLIWQAFLKANPDSCALPVILPVVLAQNDKAWEVKTQFADLLDAPQELGAELAQVSHFGRSRLAITRAGGAVDGPGRPHISQRVMADRSRGLAGCGCAAVVARAASSRVAAAARLVPSRGS